MLQDLAYGRLENEFYHLQPSPEDLVICFQNNQVLLKQEGDQFLFPAVAEVTALTEQWDPWYEEGLRYVFRLQEKNFFLWSFPKEKFWTALWHRPVFLLFSNP